MGQGPEVAIQGRIEVECEPSSTYRATRLNELDVNNAPSAVWDYCRGIPDKGHVSHFRWPTFNNTKLLEVPIDELYDDRGVPTDLYIAYVAESLQATLARGDENYLILIERQTDETDDDGNPIWEYVSGGLTDADTVSENQAWFNNAVVHPDFQGQGEGTLLEATRIDEFFRTHGDERTNLYIGANIPTPGLTQADCQRIQTAYIMADILEPLLEGQEIGRNHIEQRVQSIADFLRIAYRNVPIDDERLQRTVDLIPDDTTYSGIDIDTLKLRRAVIEGVVQAIGHDLTTIERVVLKLGGQLKQMLPNEVQALQVNGKDEPFTKVQLPTRRLLIDRAVWERTRHLFDALPVAA